MKNFFLALKDIWRLTKPYFFTKDKGVLNLGWLGKYTFAEKWIAWGLLALIVAINIGQVAISVRLSYFNRDWFNAIQEKDAGTFWSLLLTVWFLWASVYVMSYVVEYVITSEFKIRWRRWLTMHYQHTWLDGAAHYRVQFVSPSIDNPDQRIAEDLNRFVSTTLSLSVGLMNQVSTLLSFSVILWGISSNFSIPGTDIFIPGLLFWIALVYAGVGTFFAHLIGKSLVHLSFEQEKKEADYRFSLARLREYAEPVALMRGEPAENTRLTQRFQEVIQNFYKIVSTQKYLTAFTQTYSVSSSVVPYLVVAPFYFAGKVQLGVMTQTASAFGRVEGALSFFVSAYSQIADYKAVVDRLTGFNAALGHTKTLGQLPPRLEHTTHSHSDVKLDGLCLRLPDGRKLVHATELTFPQGQSALLTGPSGSGKSTLFRAIAGIWPFGEGVLTMPQGHTSLLLPQRPYMPMGTLRGVVSYPADEGAYSDEALQEALRHAHMPHLTTRLDEVGNWAQMLSGGEQQRVAIARALLLKPDWLYLDEATSALDEATEGAIYAMLKSVLPASTLISIGHRSTLIAMHDEQIQMQKGTDGCFTPTPKMRAP
jgi:vitamin B12/bleomycin/antimicrobial peptide transport system ATP-binding/permease protein